VVGIRKLASKHSKQLFELFEEEHNPLQIIVIYNVN
jgi:hypothetical protein